MDGFDGCSFENLSLLTDTALAGNKRFRQLVELTAPLYDAAQTKQEKTMVIASLVNRIRRESPQEGGGFIKRDSVTGFWYEIGDDKARDKVGHAIRRVLDEKTKKKVNLPSLAKLVSSSEKEPADTAQEPINSLAPIDSFDVKPSMIQALSMPMKMDPLPMLDNAHAIVASLPQNHQPNLLSINNTAFLGPPHGSFPMTYLSRNDIAKNVNSTTRPIPSSSYIGGSGGGTVDPPHLSGLGNLAGNEYSAVMQLRRHSLSQTSEFASANLFRLLSQPATSLQDQFCNLSGAMTNQDKMIPNPIDVPNASTSQRSDYGSPSFLPSDDAAMEQLLSTLNPTPIGPRAINASTTDKEDDTWNREQCTSPP